MVTSAETWIPSPSLDQPQEFILSTAAVRPRRGGFDCQVDLLAQPGADPPEFEQGNFHEQARKFEPSPLALADNSYIPISIDPLRISGSAIECVTEEKLLARVIEAYKHMGPISHMSERPFDEAKGRALIIRRFSLYVANLAIGDGHVMEIAAALPLSWDYSHPIMPTAWKTLFQNYIDAAYADTAYPFSAMYWKVTMLTGRDGTLERDGHVDFDYNHLYTGYDVPAEESEKQLRPPNPAEIMAGVTVLHNYMYKSRPR